MRCRHRVSKLLLLHARVYPASAWTKTDRGWLEEQRFEEPASELAFLDALAAVDGLAARKAALDERLSRLAREGEWWPTVARLRCFRDIDTLSAFVLCLESGDWTRFSRHRLRARGKARQRRDRRRGPRARLLPLGCRRGRLIPDAAACSGGRRATRCRHAR